MKYAHVDADLNILGWYSPEVHTEIPEPHMQVSDDLWKAAISANHNRFNLRGVSFRHDPRTAEEIL